MHWADILLDRSKPGKLVEKVAEIYNNHDKFSICITPEGKKYAAEWKTRFHKIAMAVKLTCSDGSFYYRTKSVVIAPPFTPSDDTQGDIEKNQSLGTGNLKEKYRNMVLNKKHHKYLIIQLKVRYLQPQNQEGSWDK